MIIRMCFLNKKNEFKIKKYDYFDDLLENTNILPPTFNEEKIDVVCVDKDQKSNCAIKLGNVYCDGYNDNARIGCFSHFHQDHILILQVNQQQG